MVPESLLIMAVDFNAIKIHGEVLLLQERAHTAAHHTLLFVITGSAEGESFPVEKR